ncbi:class I poly(R)-hydroxyalkanoic acid synthase [Rickettsiales bacterium]|nr:class I poly(R)-hydroxyalkanoic acid synthase [Rickettsiales bacterium]
MNKVDDSNELPENLDELFKLYKEISSKAIETSKEIFPSMMPMQKIWQNMGEIANKAMADPDKLYQQQLDLYTDYTKVWGNALGRYMGEENKPLYTPDPKDKRFSDEDWNQSIFFDFIKQSYLLTVDRINAIAEELAGSDPKTKEKYQFYAKQWINALSPTNFVFTNPEVLKKTIETKGENLTHGFRNFLNDLDRNNSSLKIKSYNDKAFKLGENIASTKGSVILRNELMELIQYSPSTDKCYKTPLLLIPAWINKYYILDLSQNNSLVKWLVDKGYTVFIISWVNPDKSLAKTRFEDYMTKGPLAALDAIEKATGEKEITAMGYCLGGTLLSATLAYMAAKNDKRIKAASLLTTMVDFSYVGEMSLFISEDQIDETDRHMKEVGYLDGSEMSGIFSLLRSNDLIWSFAVNNYLMGKEPMPFDILYWNADSTRLPAETHSFYLRKMYLRNVFAKSNGIKLNNTPIDVKKIKTPAYILSTKEDHIAPWQTTYKTNHLFSGDTNFVLSDSGHVAGVVNPPAKKRYCYWTNNIKPKSANEWLKKAQKHEGSWWDDWHKWNQKHSGQKVKSRIAGGGKLKEICPAPGEYVLVRSD